MTLEAGMIAPPFRISDIFDTPITLNDYRGSSLLLSFFRNAACALCNLRVHQLIERYPELQRAGLSVVAVFESPRENILQYVGKQSAPFPIVADPEARLYISYGVESSAQKVADTMARADMQQKVDEAAAQGFALTKEAGSNFTRLPADFLIGPDGTLLVAHYAEYVWDHLPFATLETALHALPANV